MDSHLVSATATPTPAPGCDWSWGVDTVTVSYGVVLDQCDPSSPLWSRSSSTNLRDDLPEAEVFTGFLHLPEQDVRVTLYTARSICHLHFNAARFVGSGPTDLCPADAVRPLVHRLIEQLHGEVWPEFAHVDEVSGEIHWDSDWASKVRIKRLDLARNFQVSDPAVVKTGLSHIQTRYQRTRSVEESAGGGWTVWNRTKKSGSDRLYDKSAELDLVEGQEAISSTGSHLFRFEAQLEKERLRSLGVATIDALDEAKAWAALNARWGATRWGSPLPRRGDAAQAVQALKPRDQATVLGYLHLAAEGLTDGFSDWQRRDLTKKAKSCGLTPGVPVVMLGPPSQRLDLLSGSLVHLTDAEVQRLVAPV